MLGVPAHTLRFWETEFKLRIVRSQSGRRVYGEQDIALLKEIQQLLHQKNLKIRGARERLHDEGKLHEDNTNRAPTGSALPPRKRQTSDIPPPPPSVQSEDPPQEQNSRERLQDIKQEKIRERERRFMLEELQRIKNILEQGGDKK